MSLIDELKRRQRDHNWIDREFAAELGVPRSTWTATRLGLKRPGRRLYQGVLRRFPELSGYVETDLKAWPPRVSSARKSD